ncbi:MAG: hypothetical protein WC675_01945 [Patescibacteria group bacterium]|jgi:hypothetical protein
MDINELLQEIGESQPGLAKRFRQVFTTVQEGLKDRCPNSPELAWAIRAILPREEAKPGQSEKDRPLVKGQNLWALLVEIYPSHATNSPELDISALLNRWLPMIGALIHINRKRSKPIC